MYVGLIDCSKLPLGVSVCDEQMTSPGYIPASRLATPEIDTVNLMRIKSETSGMDGLLMEKIFQCCLHVFWLLCYHRLQHIQVNCRDVLSLWHAILG